MGWAIPFARWFANAANELYGIQFHWILIISFTKFQLVFGSNPIKDDDDQTDVITGDCNGIISPGGSRIVSIVGKKVTIHQLR
jgi:hypothetical protein